MINPGAIENVPDDASDQNAPYPCILFFDSLKAHRSNLVAKNVRKWLNSEWARLKAAESDAVFKLFSPQSMPVYSPKSKSAPRALVSGHRGSFLTAFMSVPYQDNSWDCGVFVCRYAYAMYLLRDKAFSLGDVNDDGTKRFSFASLITNTEAFAFDMSDIVRIRGEMKTLIRNLSKVFVPWREEEARKEKEAARKEKQNGSVEKNDEEEWEQMTEKDEDVDYNGAADVQDGSMEDAKPAAKENEAPTANVAKAETFAFADGANDGEKPVDLRKTMELTDNESFDPIHVDKPIFPPSAVDVEDSMDIEESPVELSPQQQSWDVVEIVEPRTVSAKKPVVDSGCENDYSVTSMDVDKTEANEARVLGGGTKVLEMTYAETGFLPTAKRRFRLPQNNEPSLSARHPGEPGESYGSPDALNRPKDQPLLNAVSFSDEKSDSDPRASAMNSEVEFVGSRTPPVAYSPSGVRADGTSITRYTLNSESEVTAMRRGTPTGGARRSVFPIHSEII